MSKLIPYNVMRHSEWDKAPRMPEAIALAIVGAKGTAAYYAVYFASYVAITAVTSWAISALSPTPDFSAMTGSQGRLVNAKNPAAPHDFVYGQVRKGGVVTYYETTGSNNKFLHQVIAIAGHEVEEIGDIYLNDEVVDVHGPADPIYTIEVTETLLSFSRTYEIQVYVPASFDIYDVSDTLNETQYDALIAAAKRIIGDPDGDLSYSFSSAEITAKDYGAGVVTGDKWNSKIRIQKFDGTQTTAPADLLAESEQITSAFVGRGIAYLYVRYQYDQEVFANGLPLITAVVKGKKVYDPRTATTAYSSNPALCIRDYIGAAYGLQDGDVDDVSFQAAANVCDEAVTLAGGGTEDRYTMNGVFTAGTVHRDVLSQMMTSCAGTLFWGGGKFKLVASEYVAPTKVLTLDDLRSPISLDTRTNLRDQFNKVQGTFNDASNRWITADYPPITSSVFEAEDGGEQTPLDLELPMTTSGATAQRIAKLTLYRGREQMALTADFGLNALDVEVGEIVSLPFERYGWDNIAGMPAGKEFEVTGWKFGPSGEGGDLRVTLSLREISEAAFDWTAEEQDIISNNTTLLSYTEVPTLGIPAEQIVPSLRIVREKLTEVISINVTAGRPEAVDRVEVQYAEATSSDWKSLGSGDLGTYELVDAEPGSYKFRARAINSFGYFGDYTVSGSVATKGSASPPQDVDGLFYEVSEGTTTLEWEPVTDLDLSFYRIRHAVEQTAATWANATTAVDKVPRPGTSVALPTRPGSYLIRAYDKTGIASLNYTTVSVSEDEVPSFTQTLTQTDSPTFGGTKTDCELSGIQLQITDPSTAPSEATYDFSTYIQTHDSTARRVRARVDAAVFRSDESAGLWDDLPGLFDDLPGLFDTFTGSTQAADTNLLFYISTTPDDPAGTPTWSDYKQFRAGEFYGRAFRFRVVLKSTADNITPAITSLSAIVEYN